MPLPSQVDYEVSDAGRVRRVKVLAPVPSRGYLRVNLRVGWRTGLPAGYRPVHALVAEAFLGPRPTGMTVNHKDGDKANNRPENLEYVTAQENVRHAIEAGLIKAKLSTALAAEIRSLRGTATKRELAARYGVSFWTIKAILAGRTWKPLP